MKKVTKEIKALPTTIQKALEKHTPANSGGFGAPGGGLGSSAAIDDS